MHAKKSSLYVYIHIYICIYNVYIQIFIFQYAYMYTYILSTGLILVEECIFDIQQAALLNFSKVSSRVNVLYN